MALKRIYSFYDDRYAPLVRIFKNTIKDDYEIKLSKIDSVSGQEVWVEKTKAIIRCIEENMGDHVVFSDVDIQFFRKTRPSIEMLFGNDMMVQWQVGDVANIGFMVIRCHENMLAFFDDVLNKSRLGQWDQKTVNDKLMSENLKWSFLPKSFYAFHAKNPIPPRNSVLHHATWEYTPYDKIMQMKAIRKQLCCEHL